jgi:hypothetical protein
MAMSDRSVARPNGVWEVVGVLAAVVPCGVLAGLYLATEDMLFLLACFGLAVIAVGLVFARNLGNISMSRRRSVGGLPGAASASGKAMSAGRKKLDEIGASFRRTFTVRILKLLGLVSWFVAWAVLVSIHLRVIENPNVIGLVIWVAVGAFSPIFIYFGLETGVKKLGNRMRDDR